MPQRSEVPEGWVDVKLADICSKPQYGWTTSASREEGGLKFLRTTDISNGVVNWQSVPYCEKDPEKPEKYLLKQNDIVISRAGSVGLSYLIEECPPTVFASYLIRFETLSPISTKYIYAFLKSPRYWNAVSENSTGIALPNVNASKLKNITIPLPPLTEQHRIVAAIEALFARLDAAEARLDRVPGIVQQFRQAVLAAACDGRLTEEWRNKNQEVKYSNLSERDFQNTRTDYLENENNSKIEITKKSLRNKAVVIYTPSIELPSTWGWFSPSDIGDNSDPYALAIGPFGSNLKVSDYQKKGIPLVFVRNIRSKIFDDEKTHYVTEEKGEELRPHRISPGDILITKMGEPPGDACIYPTNCPEAIITADCIKLNINCDIANSTFIVHAINSNIVKQQIMRITMGVAQRKISLSRFKTILLPIPPLPEQNEIVRRVDALFALADTIEANVAAAKDRTAKLRQSILAQAFAGQLVPTEAELARREGREYESAAVLLERSGVKK